MNALYGVYSLHISHSKIKPLLKICKGLASSDLAVLILQLNLKALQKCFVFGQCSNYS